MNTKVSEIINDIENQISKNVLVRGDQLLTLTELRSQYEISRDTGIRAYKNLTSRGIITAVQGKGYFVAKTKPKLRINLFLLLDELSTYKDVLVKSIKKNLEDIGLCTVFFHHYNPNVFEDLVNNAIGKFNYYAISPFPDSTKVRKALESIPREQLILLDRQDGQNTDYSFIGQNYSVDIQIGLKKLRASLYNYDRLLFVFSEKSYHPSELKKGFKKFCIKNKLHYKILNGLDTFEVKRKDAFLVIDDDDLVTLVEKCHVNNWELGKDIGLVSYNETRLKSVIANGVTTLSTDFSLMGEQLIKAIKGNLPIHVYNKAKVTKRKSL